MPKKAAQAQSYQELSLRLDGLVAKLQDPEVPLDDATRYYEQAMELIAKLEQHVTLAENQVREIRARFSKE